MEMGGIYQRPQIQEGQSEAPAGGGIEVIGGATEVGVVGGAGAEERRNPKLQEKIDVVLQILTVLESAMSSAESAHQKKKSDCLSRISQLQLEIDKLRQEMSLDEEQFREVNKTLGSSIRLYIAAENKLRTVEERSQDDTIVLPDLDPKTDSVVDQYLTDKHEEWHALRRQHEKLNCDTQRSAYYKDLFVRRFKVCIPSSEATQVNQKTVGAANALNTFRGKKFIGGNQAVTQELFFTMTCYKNENSAVAFVQKNSSKILEDVVGKQYNNYVGKPLVITELASDDDFDPVSMIENTIHVRPKPKENSDSSPPNMSKRITLYQFDDRSCRRQSQVTTVNIESATIADVNDNNNLVTEDNSVPTSLSSQLDTRQNQVRQSKSKKERIPSSTNYNTSRRQELNQSQRHQIAVKTSKILSFIGVDDGNTSNIAPIPMENNNIVSDKHQRNPTSGSLTGSASGNKQQSPLKSSNTSVGPLNVEDDDVVHEVDGIVLNEWALFYVEQKGIEKFTEIQKEMIDSFKLQGDILYKGVANSGKTTTTILGLINNLDADTFRPQALVVTPNARSSKLIQKLSTIEAGRHMITCKRYEELVDPNDPSKTKNSKLASHVVVGSPQEICDLATKSKNLVNTERINYLVLYKIDEIAGSESLRKSIFTTITKILYALNATIKVIVVCKTNAKMNKEMEDLCHFKLRNKIILDETVDIEEFLHVRPRMRTDDKASKYKSKVGPNHSSAKSVPLPKRIRSGENVSVPSPMPSLPDDEQGEGDEMDDPDNEDELQFRTFIPLFAAKMLGINVGPYPESPDSDQMEVAHFYANVDDGSDDSKADLISMLDLEEDKAIIFCNSIDKTEWLSTKLRQKQLWPQVLHEDVSMRDQRVILENFRQGSFCRVLICTDVLLSVSLDSADIVLNFDLPTSHSLYLNRTAFAFRQINAPPSEQASESQKEKKGIVVNLVVDEEMKFLTELQETIGIRIQNCED